MVYVVNCSGHCSLQLVPQAYVIVYPYVSSNVICVGFRDIKLISVMK